jgi:hypothetical protein
LFDLSNGGDLLKILGDEFIYERQKVSSGVQGRSPCTLLGNFVPRSWKCIDEKGENVERTKIDKYFLN